MSVRQARRRGGSAASAAAAAAAGRACSSGRAATVGESNRGDRRRGSRSGRGRGAGRQDGEAGSPPPAGLRGFLGAGEPETESRSGAGAGKFANARGRLAGGPRRGVTARGPPRGVTAPLFPGVAAACGVSPLPSRPQGGSPAAAGRRFLPADGPSHLLGFGPGAAEPAALRARTCGAAFSRRCPRSLSRGPGPARASPVDRTASLGGVSPGASRSACSPAPAA